MQPGASADELHIESVSDCILDVVILPDSIANFPGQALSELVPGTPTAATWLPSD